MSSKKAATSAKPEEDEFEIHDDEDFDAVLSLLDEEEEINKAKKARLEEPKPETSRGRHGKLSDCFVQRFRRVGRRCCFSPITPAPSIFIEILTCIAGKSCPEMLTFTSVAEEQTCG